jgi:hypothetical protein
VTVMGLTCGILWGCECRLRDGDRRSMKVEGWDGRWARMVLAWRRLKDVVSWVDRAVKVRRARRMGLDEGGVGW